ncbi:MAG: hypothetical protein WCA00_16380 [Candidatus Acidiferrales bacterium]
MKFARWVFLIAGIYGLLVITPLYFMEGVIAKQTPPPITHPEFFYGFVGVALACQILFLFVASDPQRFRLMMLPSILEKISYGIALLVLHQQQRIPASSFRIGMVDWIWALLFTISFIRTPQSSTWHERSDQK